MTDTTQPPAETLAECPFCGGAAQLKGANAPEYWVACPAIGCKASTEGFGSKDRAIAAWNRRAALTRRAGGDAGTVATIADLQRRRASDLDAVVNLSLCLKEARDALEWYRDTVGRCRMMHAEGDEARNALHKDCGERAEKALAFRVPAREPKHDQ